MWTLPIFLYMWNSNININVINYCAQYCQHLSTLTSANYSPYNYALTLHLFSAVKLAHASAMLSEITGIIKSI